MNKNFFWVTNDDGLTTVINLNQIAKATFRLDADEIKLILITGQEMSVSGVETGRQLMGLLAQRSHPFGRKGEAEVRKITSD